MSCPGSLDRAMRNIGHSSTRCDLSYAVKSSQPVLSLCSLVFVLYVVKVGRCNALQNLLKRPNVPQNTSDPSAQVGRQALQKLKSTINSRRRECAEIVCPYLPQRFRVHKPLFCPFRLQGFSQRPNRRIDRGQFGRDVGQDNYGFSRASFGLLRRDRLTFDSYLLRAAFGEKICPLSKPPHRDARHNCGQNAPKCHYKGSGGEKKGTKRNGNRPSIPPNNTITYARLHAWAHTTPQIANPAHFQVPLWTGRHSAMPMQRAESAHG